MDECKFVVDGIKYLSVINIIVLFIPLIALYSLFKNEKKINNINKIVSLITILLSCVTAFLVKQLYTSLTSLAGVGFCLSDSNLGIMKLNGYYVYLIIIIALVAIFKIAFKNKIK